MNPRFLTVLKRKYCRREHLEYTDWYSKHFKRLKSSKRFCLVTKEVNKTYRISYWLAFGQRRNEQLFLKKATLFKLNYSNLYEHFMTRLQDSCIWSTLSLLRQSPSPGCWRAAGSSWSKARTFFFFHWFYSTCASDLCCYHRATDLRHCLCCYRRLR